ncbi:MAG: ATP-binding cassette domain-containing protein [Planctomycetes bacterium]|nr:ATP-binding cassette domain-containing protein [Planctomycetota bacterium]
MSYALEAEKLGKAYRVYAKPLRRVGEWLSFGRYKGHHEFWALRGVDLALKPGSSLGLCGANGAGKSTLLKVLAGTTAPTEGRYRVRGRVASLLELGAGFHMDFTGRQNIILNGVMMGFTRRELLAKTPEIIDFAELGSYIDEPVRTYSSGMGLRLGFAIAASVDPEVLIIDEVFAVGDMYFQKKCVDRIYTFKQRNKTIVFCSHSLYDVRQFCDQALWLERGEPRAIGDSVFVTNEYAAFQRQHIGQVAEAVRGEHPPVPGVESMRPEDMPSVLDARIYRLGTDEECYQVQSGDSIELRVWWKNPLPEKHPIQIGIAFMRGDMTTCGGSATHFQKVELKGTQGCLVLKAPNLALLAGQFLIPVVLFDKEGVHRYQDYLMPQNLLVRAYTRDIGLFRLDLSFEQRELAPPAARPRGPAAQGA